MLTLKRCLMAFIALMIIQIPLSVNAKPKDIKSDIGHWKIEDCKKISDAAGSYLYLSGRLLQIADIAEKAGDKKKANENYEGSYFFSVLSANAAKNFEVFCKKDKK